MILMIDNYDSFTFNVYQALGSMYSDIKVVKNDEVSIEEIEKMHPEALVISPGPGDPDQAGISLEAVQYFAGKLPILGVCLGHQTIGQVFGATVGRANLPMHGKSSKIHIDNANPLFYGLPDEINVARYHSLIVEKENFPDCLKVIGEDSEGQIMAVCHKDYDIYGVQFHPESVLAEMGMNILHNFLHRIVHLQLEMDLEEVPEEKRTVLKQYISKVANGQSLSQKEAKMAMTYIVEHAASRAQIAAFFMAEHIKGITEEEKLSFEEVLKEHPNSIVQKIQAQIGIDEIG